MRTANPHASDGGASELGVDKTPAAGLGGQSPGLTSDDISSYRTLGFVQKVLFTDEEMGEVRGQLEAIETEGKSSDSALLFTEDGVLFQVFDVPKRGGALLGVTWDERLLACVCQLLGSTPIVAQGLMLEKAAQANWDIPWHQDTSVYCEAVPPGEVGETRGGLATFRPRDGTMARLVTARVALDADRSESGGLFVIPGSHTYGNLWRDGGTRFEGQEGHPCNQEAGTVLFFNPLLMHRADKNVTSARRRVLHLTYRRLDDALPAGGRWIAWPSL